MSDPVDDLPGSAAQTSAAPGPRELRLAAALVEAADTLTEDFEPAAHLRRLSDRCVELLGVTGAGAVLISAAPDPAAAEVSLVAPCTRADWVLGLLEVQRLGGPCLESFRTRALVPPLHPGQPEVLERWPEFARLAQRYGVTSTFAVPLRLRDTALGALTLFTDAPHPTVEVPLAQALADAAALGLAHHRDVGEQHVRAEQLQSALSSRVLIEQAKGMLAERRGIGVDAAFRALRGHARTTRLPLDRVARELLEGTLDDAVLPYDRPQGT